MPVYAFTRSILFVRTTNQRWIYLVRPLSREDTPGKLYSTIDGFSMSGMRSPPGSASRTSCCRMQHYPSTSHGHSHRLTLPAATHYMHTVFLCALFVARKA